MAQLARIAPPTVARQRGSLLAAAATGDPVPHWETGIAVDHGLCIGYALVTHECRDAGEDDEGADFGVLDAAGPYAGMPYSVRRGLQCTSVQARQELTTERLRAELDRVTAFAVAREFWTGELARQAPFDTGTLVTNWTNATDGGGDLITPYLASADVDEITGGPLLEALGNVIQEVGERTHGARVHVHMAPRLLPLLEREVDAVGELLSLRNGTVIVADPGYPGTGPDGTGDWIYGTAQPTVWLGGVDTITDPAATTDRAVNLVTIWAQRPALALVDPCSMVAAELELGA